ncbi:MAG: FAD-binding oxidoreductase [Neomegalonema sp.]|nr:FAD-binding oxidoreductase [Neomegalonema sp.]
MSWPISDHLLDWSRPEPSFWAATAPLERPGTRLTEEMVVDVAVIGGGYTGLSTALSLASDYRVQTAVIEAGDIGWGASGRNGGIVMLDATKLSYGEMFRKVGADETARYFRSQVEAVRLLRGVISAEAIECDAVNRPGITVATSEKRFEALRAEAALLRGTIGVDAEILTDGAVREQYIDSPAVFGGLRVAPGMALHPLKLAIGLARACERHGVQLYVRSPVVKWHREDDEHLLRTPSGLIRARWVVLATNAFTPDKLYAPFNGRVAPVISNIAVTRPLDEAERDACNLNDPAPMIDDRNLLRYFRMVEGGRLLLGMRSSDDGGAEGAIRSREEIQAAIAELLPPLSGIALDYFWRGPIATTMRRTPGIGRLETDPSVLYGFGYHGNGVNTAIWTGAVLAQLIAEGDATLESVPKLLRGLPPRFPLPSLRNRITGAAMKYYGFKDRMSK